VPNAEVGKERRGSAALQNVAEESNADFALAFWSAPVLRRFGMETYCTIGAKSSLTLTWSILNR